MIQGLRYI